MRQHRFVSCLGRQTHGDRDLFRGVAWVDDERRVVETLVWDKLLQVELRCALRPAVNNHGQVLVKYDDLQQRIALRFEPFHVLCEVVVVPYVNHLQCATSRDSSVPRAGSRRTIQALDSDRALESRY